MIDSNTVMWLITGAETAIVAPLIVVFARRSGWPYMRVPAALAAPGFVLLHGAIIISLTRQLPAVGALGLHVVLLLGALAFWAPIVGSERIDPAARLVYLFLSSPALDLAGVFVIVLGDASGGLAMIVGMLPMNIYAVFMLWQWVTEEERLVDQSS